MARDRRRTERRKGDRRACAGAAVDVTRVEHENLYDEVAEILRTLRRIEGTLDLQRERIDTVERDLETLLANRQVRRA